MKTALIFLLALASLAAQQHKHPDVYIVHWTSEELCYECPERFAMYCGSGDADCNVPKKTVEHFEVAKSVEATLRIANDIGDTSQSGVTFLGTNLTDFEGSVSTPQSMTGTGTIITGRLETTPARPKGKLVAIYEARRLPIEIREETVEVPQPAKKETRVKVTLK
jgi:hypothetical protein